MFGQEGEQMKQNISLEEAQNLLLERTFQPESMDVSVIEAFGRVLSQDMVATNNLPFFDRSPLDGYALLARSTEDASPLRPVCLRVLEEIPAGYVAAQKVSMGTAIKVMTGAPIPDGADVVVKFEVVERKGDVVSIFHPLKSRDNIVYSGEDINKGTVVAQRGTIVTPPLIGLLADLGTSCVSVYRQISAAILSTGDELTSLGEELRPGMIYDTNRYVLQGRCKELGVRPVMLDKVPDHKEAIAERICEGLTQADMVITTGGVSVGDYDLVKAALQTLGADIIFWKLDMKPGSPMVAATKDNKLIIGLSGSPAAALLTFDLLVIPLLRKMMGRQKYLHSKIQGILLNGYKKSGGNRRFLRACLVQKNGNLFIKLAETQNNSALQSMISCNVLVDVPACSAPLNPGDRVTAVLVGCIDNMDE